MGSVISFFWVARTGNHKQKNRVELEMWDTCGLGNGIYNPHSHPCLLQERQ